MKFILLLILPLFLLSCIEDRNSKFENNYNYNSNFVTTLNHYTYFFNEENNHLTIIDTKKDEILQYNVGNINYMSKIEFKSDDIIYKKILVLNPEQSKIYLFDGFDVVEIDVSDKFDSFTMNKEGNLGILRFSSNQANLITYSANKFAFIDFNKITNKIENPITIKTLESFGESPVSVYISKNINFTINNQTIKKQIGIIDYNTYIMLIDLSTFETTKIPLVLSNSDKDVIIKKVIFEENQGDLSNFDNNESIFILTSNANDIYKINLFIDEEDKLVSSITQINTSQSPSNIEYLTDRNGVSYIASFKENTKTLYLTNVLSDTKINLDFPGYIQQIETVKLENGEIKLLVIEINGSNTKFNFIDMFNVFTQKYKNIKTIKLSNIATKISILDKIGYILITYESINKISMLNINTLRIYEQNLSITKKQTIISENQQKIYFTGYVDSENYIVVLNLSKINESVFEFTPIKYDFSVDYVFELETSSHLMIINTEYFNDYYGFFDRFFISESNEFSFKNFNHFMIEGDL